MLKFYGDIGLRVWHSFSESTVKVEAAISVAVFLLALFNQPLTKSIIDWNGIHPGWAWVPLGVLFGHLFLKALVEKFSEWEQDLNRQLVGQVSAIAANLESKIASIARQQQEQAAITDKRFEDTEEKGRSIFGEEDARGRRLEIARQHIREHADRGRDLDWGSEAHAWMSGARDLIEGLVPAMRSQLRLGFPETSEGHKLTNQELAAISMTITSLNIIEANLTVDDLHP